MKTLILIPVRMASIRFPNKPMALIEGKTMIQRVWEQAIASNIGNVIVACSEQEVLNCIISLGGDAILTDPDLPSGTDRIFEPIPGKLHAHPGGIFEPGPYIKSALGLFEHIRSKIGWDVEILHDVHERVPPIQGVGFAKEVDEVNQ